jgi:hypothetical protein
LNEVSAVQLLSEKCSLLTGAVRCAESNDGAGDIGTASCVGAVTNTVSEVNVFAQAGSIGGRASERWGQAEHVVDTSLLGKRLALERKKLKPKEKSVRSSIA